MDRHRGSRRRAEHRGDEAGRGSRHAGRSEEAGRGQQSRRGHQAFPEYPEEEYEEFVDDWVAQQSGPGHTSTQAARAEHRSSNSSARSSASTRPATTTLASSSRTKTPRNSRHNPSHSHGQSSSSSGHYSPASYPSPDPRHLEGFSSRRSPHADAWTAGAPPPDIASSQRPVGYRPLSNWYGLWLPPDVEQDLHEAGAEDSYSDGERESDRNRHPSREEGRGHGRERTDRSHRHHDRSHRSSRR